MIRRSGREWFVPSINFPATAKSADHQKIAAIASLDRRLTIENRVPREDVGFNFGDFGNFGEFWQFWQ
jgi:hypothetical protein